MILTTHSLVGAVIGKYVSDPWIIALIAIPAHYLLDSFRHGEYVDSMDSKTSFQNTWKKSVLDILGAIVIPFSIAINQHFSTAVMISMGIGMFFSTIPDLITLFYWKFRTPFFEKIYRFHAWCHKFPREALERKWNLRNSVNDIAFSIIAIIFLFL
ncbi:MAG: hypothetical protein ACD_67C00076G0002 [uncultured bacterium]|nr:MAG: hypothetical protein ACD_67C00076G0002 [uncultured bacterium]